MARTRKKGFGPRLNFGKRRAPRSQAEGLFSENVLAVIYVGIDDERYIHVFGRSEPDMKVIKSEQWLNLDRLPFVTNVQLWARGGDVELHSPDGLPLSAEF